jgi:chitinase
MVFGIPSFGFEFKGATGPGTDFTKGTAKQVPYKDIVTNPEWEYFYDEVSEEPYGVSSTGYVTFEDPHSSAIKSRWVRDNDYAGIMVWEVSHDYIEGTGNPILDSIAVVLRDGSTDAIPYARKVRTSSQPRAQGTSGKQVDALGKSVKGKPKFIRIFEP